MTDATSPSDIPFTPTAEVINSAAYRDGLRVANVAISELGDAHRRPDCFLWVGLYEPSEELLRQVQQAFCLHDLAIDDAHKAHQRPKLETYGSSLFLVLRTAQPRTGPDKVLVTDYDFPDLDLERGILAAAGIDVAAGQCRSEAAVIEAAAGCSALLVQYAPVTDRVLAALPKVGLVSRFGAGYDTVDPAAGYIAFNISKVLVLLVPNHKREELALALQEGDLLVVSLLARGDGSPTEGFSYWDLEEWLKGQREETLKAPPTSTDVSSPTPTPTTQTTP